MTGPNHGEARSSRARTSATAARGGRIVKGIPQAAKGSVSSKQKYEDESEPADLEWYFARTKEPDGNELIHITCFPSFRILTMIWDTAAEEALTGTRLDRSRYQMLEMRKFKIDEQRSSWLKQTYTGFGHKQIFNALHSAEVAEPRPAKETLFSPAEVTASTVVVMSARLRALRTAVLGGDPQYLTAGHKNLTELLEELEVTDQHEFAARLDSAVFQVSKGDFSFRGLEASAWWARRHPIPTSAQAAEWAVGSSPAPSLSDFELDEHVTAEEPVAESSDQQLPEVDQPTWWIAKSMDNRGRELLHVARFRGSGPGLFTLTWNAVKEYSLVGIREDGDLTGELDVSAWEWDREGAGFDWLKNTPADLYTESELFHTDGCLKALPFVLRRDDPESGDPHLELVTGKAYLDALQESGQSFTPSRLEYHLTELEEKGDRSQALKLNSILVQASGS